MKRTYIYIILVAAFAAFTFLIVHDQKPELKYSLQMRQGQLAAAAEWSDVKAAIENLISNVESNPSDMRSKVALGMAYIQEGRITGNHSYYDAVALELFGTVLKKEPQNFEALVGKATILLSQHHFNEAIPVAIEAGKINPHSSASYGLLTDAYVETGQYDKAIEMADKMTSIRPDIRSYSRISYLREIFGKNIGAINAMKLAVEAGYPGAEQTEWSRHQLGRLYENDSDLLNAERCYDESIYFRPSFAWSYAGKARIAKAKGNYEEAIKLVKQAQVLLNDYSFQRELTEIYRITNQPELASQSALLAIEILAGMEGDESEEHHGHYADLELCYAYLDSYDYWKAYEHAQTEYNRRPQNIEVNMAIAWVNYKLGRYEPANTHLDVALKTNSKNPEMLYKAGLIKTANGKFSEGKKLRDESLALNRYLSPILRWEKSGILAAK